MGEFRGFSDKQFVHFDPIFRPFFFSNFSQISSAKISSLKVLHIVYEENFVMIILVPIKINFKVTDTIFSNSLFTYGYYFL